MQELVLLHSPGPIAGFPGASHGPGLVLLDYDKRTVTPVSVVAEPTQQEPTPTDHPQPTESTSTPPVASYTNGG